MKFSELAPGDFFSFKAIEMLKIEYGINISTLTGESPVNSVEVSTGCLAHIASESEVTKREFMDITGLPCDKYGSYV